MASLLGNKTPGTTVASSKASDQTKVTVMTGQTIGRISVGFKLKPVTGMRSLSVVASSEAVLSICL